MKYHTALKFIAIVLCAAALLGIVGSAAGIAVLTGFDLYDKTAEEVYLEQINDEGRSYGNHLAMRHMSEILGGCSPDMMEQIYGSWFPFRYNAYNVRLLDADGNVLYEEVRTDEPVTTYTFPIEGKYMHLVSLAPLEEAETEPAVQEETEDTWVDETIRLETQPSLTPDAPMVMSADAPPEGEKTRSAETEAAQTAPDEETVPAETAAEAPAETLPAQTAAPTVPEETLPQETVPTESVSDATVETIGQAVDSTPAQGAPNTPVASQPGKILVNGRPVTDFDVHWTQYYDYQLGMEMRAEYVNLDLPALTFVLELAPGATDFEIFMPLLNDLRFYRTQLFPLLVVCLLVFAVTAVYLCCAAGRKPKSDEVRAGGLNRIPLELYAGFTFLAITAAVWIAAEGGFEVLVQNLRVGFGLVAGLAYFSCLLLVGFLFALVAQCKTPDWFWLRNSLCGRCLRLAGWLWKKFLAYSIRFAKFLDHKAFPFLGRTLTALWNVIILGVLGAVWRWLCKCCRYIRDKTDRFLSLLPLTWQWLVTGFALVFILALLCATGSAIGVFLGLLITVGIVLIGSSHFGTLLDATKRMSRGDLNARIDEKKLYGCFKDFARNLNALANVAVVAAQKQLKSERMKTELITNVSHDIKTPLTSIISYADLLQKPHTEEEGKQYLEVLGRQSMQLKKLIEDLIEMSKASTGNLSVDITQVDAVEAVNQALGEFADKLDSAQLTPIFRHSEDAAPMMADGKLTWRVLHNLLSNAVKYALPGTRLYIDLMQLEGKVILSMKNVSRDQLNVDAEELMERFVRGDGSRNTEGSGLGLNIAKSMMELQKGSLQLLVDGDLFKVTLIFPGI